MDRILFGCCCCTLQYNKRSWYSTAAVLLQTILGWIYIHNEATVHKTMTETSLDIQSRNPLICNKQKQKKENEIKIYSLPSSSLHLCSVCMDGAVNKPHVKRFIDSRAKGTSFFGGGFYIRHWWWWNATKSRRIDLKKLVPLLYTCFFSLCCTLSL